MGRTVLRGFDPEAFTTARETKKWSRGELGRRAAAPPDPPISDVTLGRWESGATSPDIAVLAPVVRALGIDPAQVIRVPEDQRLLSDWRNLRLMTQPQAAARAGIPTSLLSRLERGQRPLASEVAQAIADALDITLAQVHAAYDRARISGANAE